MTFVDVCVWNNITWENRKPNSACIMDTACPDKSLSYLFQLCKSWVFKRTTLVLQTDNLGILNTAYFFAFVSNYKWLPTCRHYGYNYSESKNLRFVSKECGPLLRNGVIFLLANKWLPLTVADTTFRHGVHKLYLVYFFYIIGFLVLQNEKTTIFGIAKIQPLRQSEIFFYCKIYRHSFSEQDKSLVKHLGIRLPFTLYRIFELINSATIEKILCMAYDTNKLIKFNTMYSRQNAWNRW